MLFDKVDIASPADFRFSENLQELLAQSTVASTIAHWVRTRASSASRLAAEAALASPPTPDAVEASCATSNIIASHRESTFSQFEGGPFASLFSSFPGLVLASLLPLAVSFGLCRLRLFRRYRSDDSNDIKRGFARRANLLGVGGDVLEI